MGLTWRNGDAEPPRKRARSDASEHSSLTHHSVRTSQDCATKTSTPLTQPCTPPVGSTRASSTASSAWSLDCSCGVGPFSVPYDLWHKNALEDITTSKGQADWFISLLPYIKATLKNHPSDGMRQMFIDDTLRKNPPFYAALFAAYWYHYPDELRAQPQSREFQRKQRSNWDDKEPSVMAKQQRYFKDLAVGGEFPFAPSKNGPPEPECGPKGETGFGEQGTCRCSECPTGEGKLRRLIQKLPFRLGPRKAEHCSEEDTEEYKNSVAASEASASEKASTASEKASTASGKASKRKGSASEAKGSKKNGGILRMVRTFPMPGRQGKDKAKAKTKPQGERWW